ncbi:MAG: tRNA guanosine(34) transglycosylase Tgt [Alphaproteobacteria bacterium]|nr:tRNA guanosine(34) transglycosylase Tgt [Alphaproteobacteria bacterium]
MTEFRFELHNTDGEARLGTLHTAHGTVQTPAFMPVGTAATVKAMSPADVRATGAEIILANTYHLMLRPTAERIARLGGLHAFMGWSRPILTDSGGYQVLSLSALRRIDEDGVTFRSHIDGSEHRLTPERAVDIQRLLGSDITMVLDECPAFGVPADEAAASMRRSLRWAERCRKAFEARPGHGLFGIVQGGVYADLRSESAAALCSIGFEGYAIGGLAVGETPAMMLSVAEATAAQLPTDQPRYLMGVGKPDQVVAAVLRGIDMFDCVLPTRSGRTGQAFTRAGTLNMRNARHVDDTQPLDAACRCPACSNFTRAYISHLTRSGEILGAMLLTGHNITFYQDVMAELRAVIASGNARPWADQFFARYGEGSG